MEIGVKTGLNGSFNRKSPNVQLPRARCASTDARWPIRTTVGTWYNAQHDVARPPAGSWATVLMKGHRTVDRQAYIELLLDHYENPRNRGAMPDAHVVLGGGNPGCGDIVTVYLKIDEREHIAAVSFEGEGCTISQAGASVVTEMVLGKALSEIRSMDLNTMIDELGRDVVVSRTRCATLD